jgi:tetratricopeptide (TPR) repeat protein
MPAIPWRAMFSRVALVMLGVLTALVILEVGMRSAGYAMRLAQEHRNRQALGRKHELRVLCLGESTTAGSSEHGRYPEMLEDILNRQEVGVRFAVVNQGRIGATTNEIVAEIEDDLDEIEPDVVVVMMGINDGGKTHAYGSIIAPGLRRWYGSLRVYKLYRLIQFALEQKLDPAADADLLLVQGGAPHGLMRVENEEPSADQHAFPPVQGEVDERLREAARLIDEEEYDEAEAILDDLLREHPDLPQAYVELARLYRRTDRDDEAHNLLLRGADSSSPCVGLQHALAHSHLQRADVAAAIHTYRFILDSLLEPSQVWDQTYYRVALADAYEANDQLELAEQTLAEIVEEVDPWNDIPYRHLIEHYERHGKHELAAERRQAQLRIRHEHVNPTTKRNFHALRDALRARGTPLVAVQYPGRRLDTLKRMLDYDPSPVYVDNGFFREIEEESGYDALYVDRFAGDFGHLSRTANRLLALSIARAIVERLFGLPFKDDGGALALGAESLNH